MIITNPRSAIQQLAARDSGIHAAARELECWAARLKQMALYAVGRGRYQDEYRQLWDKLVPESSTAETVQGEVVRVIGRLASEYYRNGNMNWHDGYDAMLTWLSFTIHDASIFDADLLDTIEQDVDFVRQNAESGACPYTDGQDEYDRLTDRVVEWCRHNTELIPFTEFTDYDF